MKIAFSNFVDDQYLTVASHTIEHKDIIFDEKVLGPNDSFYPYINIDDEKILFLKVWDGNRFMLSHAEKYDYDDEENFCFFNDKKEDVTLSIDDKRNEKRIKKIVKSRESIRFKVNKTEHETIIIRPFLSSISITSISKCFLPIEEFYMKKNRFWASWWTSNHVKRNCKKTPFKYWVSGTRDIDDSIIKDEQSLCAVIECGSEAELWKGIGKYFPDFEIRFCDERDSNWTPSDRFPGFDPKRVFLKG